MWDIFNKKKVQSLNEEVANLKGQVQILKEDRKKVREEIGQLEKKLDQKAKELNQKTQELETYNLNLENMQSQVEEFEEIVNLKDEVKQQLLDDFKTLLVQNKDKDLDCSGIIVAEEVAKELISLKLYDIQLTIDYKHKSPYRQLLRLKSFIKVNFTTDVITENAIKAITLNNDKEEFRLSAVVTIHTYDSIKKVESDLLNHLYQSGINITEQVTQEKTIIISGYSHGSKY